ncbi:MAG: hypothetical protein ABFQ64_03070 [Campylobacterota bacterium]
MRQIKLFLYLCIFFIFTATNTFAKEGAFTSSVSFVGMSMDYREYDLSGELLDSEESSYLDLAGIEISLGYTISEDSSSSSDIKFNLMSLGGKTRYIGSYIGSGQPYGSVVSTTQNTIIDLDVSYQHSEILKNNFKLYYGLALGYREWERALSASQIEVYSWFSIRPIVGVSATIKEKFNLGISLEYQHGFDTKMTLLNPRIEFTLGGADIFEVSVPLSYKYKDNIELFLEATLQKQIIIESDVKYIGADGYYEPESTAYNSYLKLGVAYRF